MLPIASSLGRRTVETLVTQIQIAGHGLPPEELYGKICSAQPFLSCPIKFQEQSRSQSGGIRP